MTSEANKELIRHIMEDGFNKQDIDENIEWVGPKYGNDKVNF